MPWVHNKNGIPEYQASIYVKEILPTWSELYDEFYQKKHYTYQVDQDTELDPYWKMPHVRYLLGIVCNQFNMMLYEYHMLPGLIQQIHTLGFDHITNLAAVQFICCPAKFIPVTDIFQKHHLGYEMTPPPYQLQYPNGNENPFYLPHVAYIPFEEYYPNQDLILMPVLSSKRSDASNFTQPAQSYFTYPNLDPILYQGIIDWMMKDVIQYFEGEGVGWKDSAGHIIDRTPLHPMDYDRAK